VKPIPLTVTPPAHQQIPLDNKAASLDDELTSLVFRKYRQFERTPESEAITDPCSCTRNEAQDMSYQGSKYCRTDYSVAWICALPNEMAVARAMLDKVHGSLPVSPSDSNNYVLGRINQHNIVILCLPNNVYGIASAAIMVTHMLHTFTRIRVAILVGIGGGVPGTAADVRLGDIVVSSPVRGCGGVVQHDYGKHTTACQDIEVTGMLNKPPQALLTAVANLRAKHLVFGDRTQDRIDEMLTKHPHMRSDFSFPGREKDCLFAADYQHPEMAATCSGCDPTQELPRPVRPFDNTKIHYGLIASGNQVIKDGATRDRLAQKLGGALCFEMEAAGVMDAIPCLVIRGIADYADSHKNKLWQGYAAATAAAYARELLSVLSAVGVHTLPALEG
jgi:nucleoside phosphorylase